MIAINIKEICPYCMKYFDNHIGQLVSYSYKGDDNLYRIVHHNECGFFLSPVNKDNKTIYRIMECKYDLYDNHKRRNKKLWKQAEDKINLLMDIGYLKFNNRILM